MTDEKPIYERLEEQGETAKWFAKFLIYRNEKPVRRSLLGAYTNYQSKALKGSEKHYKQVPGAWREAYDKFNWKERAEAYDAKLQAEQEERERVLREIEQAHIENILTDGYSAKHKRIQILTRWIDELDKSMVDTETGEVNPKWVFPKKIEQIRGCLDDIAKELGDRVKTEKREHSGSIEFKTEWGGGSLDTDDEA